MRIRSTKPEFWRSKTIATLSWEARLVLKGLESYVDDNGVGKDDLALIAADVFPRDLSASPRETLERLSEAISALSEAGLIARYEVDGESLIYIDRWKDIQRIDKPGRGRFPRPDGTLQYSEDVNRDSYAKPRESVARATEVLAPGTGEQGNRGTGERGRSRQASNSLAPGREPRPTLDEISGTAHSPAAHKHVQAYAKTCAKRPPGSVLRKLGAGVDELLAASYEPQQIDAALTEWGRKGIGAQHLPSVAHEMVNGGGLRVVGRHDPKTGRAVDW
jgi:hypothetical protein